MTDGASHTGYWISRSSEVPARVANLSSLRGKRDEERTVFLVVKLVMLCLEKSC